MEMAQAPGSDVQALGAAKLDRHFIILYRHTHAIRDSTA